MSVSTVATMLSAYYVFIWNPHAGNSTQTPNAERLVMALQRASGEYVFANIADHEYTGKNMGNYKFCKMHNVFLIDFYLIHTVFDTKIVYDIILH